VGFHKAYLKYSELSDYLIKNHENCGHWRTGKMKNLYNILVEDAGRKKTF
jgi:hypothetical protein